MRCCTCAAGIVRCTPAHTSFALAVLFLTAVTAPLLAGPLPDIQRGDIAIQLTPVATGMSAPLYGISPPSDNRMFVLEQKGLVQIVQNGALQPGVALDIQSRVAPPLVPTNANDERGLLGIAFHPGFNTATSPGFRTLYTYHSEPVGTGVTFP